MVDQHVSLVMQYLRVCDKQFCAVWFLVKNDTLNMWHILETQTS